MSYLVCPKCKSTNNSVGYGFAAGPLGGYTFCDGCDVLLEFSPDVDGLSEEDAKTATEKRDTYMKALWGEDWKP